MARTKRSGKKAAAKATASNGEYGSASLKEAKVKKKMKSNGAKHDKPQPAAMKGGGKKNSSAHQPRFAAAANIEPPGKKRAKKKSKKPKPSKKFKLRLHNKENGRAMHEVPWGRFDARIAKEKANEWDDAEASTAEQRRLPWASVSQEAWHRLDCEIISFARYTRLRHCEVQAREFVVSEIASICENLFRGDDVAVKPFGSYATPAVCSFTSDVDLVLWGAVPLPTRTIFEDDHDAGHNHDPATEADCMEPDGKRVKRSTTPDGRLQKWREALQEEHDRRLQEEDAVEERKLPPSALATAPPAGRKQEKPIETKNEEDDRKDARGELEEAPTHAVFVIDREGAIELVAEASEHGNDSIEASKETKKESTEDSAKETEPKQYPRSFVVIDRTGMADGELSEDMNSCDSTVGGDLEKNAATIACTSDEGTYSAASAIRRGRSTSESDDDKADKLEGLSAKPASSKAASQSHDGQSGENDSNEKSNDMEVMFVAGGAAAGRMDAPPAMDESTRYAVVNALRRVAKKVTRSDWVESVEVRRWAKVPIINMRTVGGFECDAAIGGHNGMDTSHYASSLAERYRSFADVALFLKVLTAQQDLDKPFTGGLGSWKIYVMLSYHLEKHIASGGNDRPSEVLLSFLFRYAVSNRPKYPLQSKLNQDTRLTCRAGGVAEFAAVTRIGGCCELCAVGFSRLMNLMCAKADRSCLSCLLDVKSLRSERDGSLSSARDFNSMTATHESKNGKAKSPKRQRRHGAERVLRSSSKEQKALLFAGGSPGRKRKRK